MTDGLTLPEGFRFGVATAGFQVEGHYNGPGEPRNNWFGWEQAGRVDPSGIALDFWERYPDHLDRAVAAGCDSFRLSIEWARCQPSESGWDTTAFDRYRDILSACRERGLDPLVTLHHFTHPGWLGEEFWLRLDAPERFASWVARAVRDLAPFARRWVTLNEINVCALQSFFVGAFPPGDRLAMGKTVRALDHLLTAHVLAHAQIHEQQPDAEAATNPFAFSVYELDQLLGDVLLARLHGITRDELHRWLEQRRCEYHDTIGPVTRREAAMRTVAKSSIPLEQALPRAVSAVYESSHVCTQDVTQLNYYNPVVGSHLRVPGHRTLGGRNWLPGRLHWDDRPDPERFRAYVPPKVAPGRPLWIVENGMCNRVRDGRSHPRADGWTRPRYLMAHLTAMADLIDRGVPIGSYHHWSLADNYEWGSYEPRFGLYGIDRTRGVRWLDCDSMGDDAAGTYRRLIEALRHGDRTSLGAELAVLARR
ncbi:MAG: family 1 glycosylhydrolase [Actinomycetota bacterium]|nr:family 1 glycosylhydrolase [Actinomycetota bacterium]